MKYKHYAPNANCILVYSEQESKMINKINEMTKNYQKEGKNVVVFSKKEHLSSYISKNVWNMGETLEDIAKNIFMLLRKVDKENADIVLIEGVGNSGIGLAITNRLIRACAYQYIIL